MRLSLTVVVLAALTTALAAAAPRGGAGCHPMDGLGTITLRHRAIDLATCAERRAATAPSAASFATVRRTGSGRSARDTIWVGSRPVFSARVVGDTYNLESPGPIELLGSSGDRRWIFFAIDSGGSASIAADGLVLRVVSASGARAHKLGVMLPYRDYLTWCGGRLVFSAGPGREAMHHKRLMVAAPPNWRAHPLVPGQARAWGSLACDGQDVVVQSQPSATFDGFLKTSWSLWRVRPDGTRTRLTRPPAGFVDETPRVSRDRRTIMFVRSRQGHGTLYALRDRRLLGPLLSLGFSGGYYGRQTWWDRMSWSLENSG